MVKVEHTGTEFAIASCYVPPDSRGADLELADIDERPLIVMGDFNTKSDEIDLKVITNSNRKQRVENIARFVEFNNARIESPNDHTLTNTRGVKSTVDFAIHSKKINLKHRKTV